MMLCSELKTILIGDLQGWMDSHHLVTSFSTGGEMYCADVITDEQTGKSFGYGFIEFSSRCAAKRFLKRHRGTIVPSSGQCHQMDWAICNIVERHSWYCEGSNHIIFVGDLAYDVTNYLLQETFRSRYNSVNGAVVVTNRLTGRSMGYGFVSFADEGEQMRAITEMQGVLCSKRPMRIELATNEKPAAITQPKGFTFNAVERSSTQDDVPDHSIFVGNLSGHVTDDYLQETFRARYNSVVGAMTVTDKRTGRSKGYGFVRFADEGEQMRAITEMQGVLCSTRPMRIKLATNKKPAATTQPKDSTGSMMQPANGAMPPNVMGPRPDEVRTLWIGDLEYWMDKNYLQTCFSETGTMTFVKVITNKQTRQPKGYGYVEFNSRAIAEKVLKMYNGTIMPNGGQSHRLDWATCNPAEKSSRQDDGSNHTIFVGNLSGHVTNDLLHETFRARYDSVIGAMIVRHEWTNMGYGFVRFSDEGELMRAITEMQGVLCAARPMRIEIATNRIPAATTQPKEISDSAGSMMRPANGAMPPTYIGIKAPWFEKMLASNVMGPHRPPRQPARVNEVRTLWIGNLQYWMDEDCLYTCFGNTVDVTFVKVIRNKKTSQSEGYGFIEFNTRATAERVLQEYQGTIMPIGGQSYRLSWVPLNAVARLSRRDDGPVHTIFVGNLAADVTDYLLQETFRAHYNSVKGANIVIDRLTGNYGFVIFADEGEQMRAMREMQGVVCSTRPMRIGPGNMNPAALSAMCAMSEMLGWGFGRFERYADEGELMSTITLMQRALCSARYTDTAATTQPKASYSNTQGKQREIHDDWLIYGDPKTVRNAETALTFNAVAYSNTQGKQREIHDDWIYDDPTTIEVLHLDPHDTEDQLRQVFSQYGELVYVKIPLSLTSGFVQFLDGSCAEEAYTCLSKDYSLMWIRSSKEDLERFGHEEFPRMRK